MKIMEMLNAAQGMIPNGERPEAEAKLREILDLLRSHPDFGAFATELERIVDSVRFAQSTANIDEVMRTLAVFMAKIKVKLKTMPEDQRPGDKYIPPPIDDSLVPLLPTAFSDVPRDPSDDSQIFVVQPTGTLDKSAARPVRQLPKRPDPFDEDDGPDEPTVQARPAKTAAELAEAARRRAEQRDRSSRSPSPVPGVDARASPESPPPVPERTPVPPAPPSSIVIPPPSGPPVIRQTRGEGAPDPTTVATDTGGPQRATAPPTDRRGEVRSTPPPPPPEVRSVTPDHPPPDSADAAPSPSDSADDGDPSNAPDEQEEDWIGLVETTWPRRMVAIVIAAVLLLVCSGTVGAGALYWWQTEDVATAPGTAAAAPEVVPMLGPPLEPAPKAAPVAEPQQAPPPPPTPAPKQEVVTPAPVPVVAPKPVPAPPPAPAPTIVVATEEYKWTGTIPCRGSGVSLSPKSVMIPLQDPDGATHMYRIRGTFLPGRNGECLYTAGPYKGKPVDSACLDGKASTCPPIEKI